MKNETEQIAKSLFALCMKAAPGQGPTGARDVICVVVDLKKPLGKKFWIDETRTIQKKAEVSTSFAAAMQFHVPDHDALAKLLQVVGQCKHAAIINAVFPAVPVAAEFRIGSRAQIRRMLGDSVDVDGIHQNEKMVLVARVKDQTKSSTWQLLDRDVDSFTPEQFASPDYAEWLAHCASILVGVDKVSRVVVPSSSSRVLDATGAAIGLSNGHTWIKVMDAEDVERTRAAITARAIVGGMAWLKPRFSRATGKQLNGRGIYCTVIDAAVWSRGRLIFEGSPVVEGELSVSPVALQVHKGEQDMLDTSASVIDAVGTFKASKAKGSPVRVRIDGAGGVTISMDNLSMTTVIETVDGEITTVAQLCATVEDGVKVRCQAAFRSSESMAAFFALDHSGAPFVFDVGTGVKHTLPMRKLPGWNRALEDFYFRVKGRIGHLLDDADLSELAIDETALVRIISGMCWEPDKSKLAVLNDHEASIRLTTNDFTVFGMNQIHGGGWIDFAVLKEHFDRIDSDATAIGAPGDPPSMKLREALREYETEALIRESKLHRQINARVVVVDMFNKRASMELVGDVQHLTLPFRPLITTHSCTLPQYEEVVADYKDYWPLFEEWLAVLTAARFAPDRRKAFQWLLAPPSWGKGFLMAALLEHGLVFNASVKEVEAIMEGKPAALSLGDCLYAWVMHTDEWKAASREIKQLNTAIEIAPKNQLRVRVQLFTKIFASAENVRSLIEQGVEKQFAERFSLVQPVASDEKVKPLEEREVFQRHGKAIYFQAIVACIGEQLTAHVEHYRNMGRADSAVHADKIVNAFHAQYGLAQSFASLDDMVGEVADGLKAVVLKYVTTVSSVNFDSVNSWASIAGISKLLRERLDSCTWGYVSTNEGSRRKALVVKAPSALLRAYLEFVGYEMSVLLKLSYKTEQILAMVRATDVDRNEKVRVYANSNKCIRGDGSSLKAHFRGDVIWADK